MSVEGGGLSERLKMNKGRAYDDDDVKDMKRVYGVGMAVRT